MTWDPNQPRVPAGSSSGGRWGGPGQASAKKSTPVASVARTHTARSKSSASKAVPKLGKARGADAAKVQQDEQAQKLYEQAMGMDSSQRAVFMRKLPPDQLEKLTAILYSFPTSDRSVVAARIAVANEMTRRGIDIKEYGALGGGVPSHTGHSQAAHRVLAKVAAGRSAHSSTSAAAKRAAQDAARKRATSQVHGTFRTRAE